MRQFLPGHPTWMAAYPRTLLFLIAVSAASAGLSLREDAGAGAAGPYPELVIDCDAAAGIQERCQYAVGQTFAVQVWATKVPANGYLGFQAKLRWLDSAIDYLPAAQPRAEVLWPDCAFAARMVNGPGDPRYPAGSESVLVGCAEGPGLPPSAHTGALLQLQLRCDSAASSPLTLVPHAGDLQGGSHFVDPDQAEVDSALRGAVVGCGVAPEGEAEVWEPPSPAPPAPPPQTIPGRMEMDCDGATPGIQSHCAYDLGETFTLQVHLTALPETWDAGSGHNMPVSYGAIQVKLSWNSEPTPPSYIASTTAATEIRWPDCDVSARVDNRPAEQSAVWGCVSLRERGSSFTGAIVEVTMRCGQQESLSVLTLDSAWSDPAFGTQLIDASGEPRLVDVGYPVGIGCGIPADQVIVFVLDMDAEAERGDVTGEVDESARRRPALLEQLLAEAEVDQPAGPTGVLGAPRSGSTVPGDGSAEPQPEPAPAGSDVQPSSEVAAASSRTMPSAGGSPAPSALPAAGNGPARSGGLALSTAMLAGVIAAVGAALLLMGLVARRRSAG